MTDWPQEIRGPKRLANFRPSLKDRSKKKVSAQERREGNSEKHLAFIRKLPCAVCLKVGKSDPHHLKLKDAGKERGMGMRATDRYAVPLCRPHHDALEAIGSRHEDRWFIDNGIPDVLELSNALYLGSGDVGKGIKIIMAHRSGK